MLLQFHPLLSELPYYLALPQGFYVHLLSIVMLVLLVDPLIQSHLPPQLYWRGSEPPVVLHFPPTMDGPALLLLEYQAKEQVPELEL